MSNQIEETQTINGKTGSGLVLRYTLAEYPPSKETIAACDRSRKAFQDLLVNTAKQLDPLYFCFIWLITRFYTRKITTDSINYHFHFLP